MTQTKNAPERRGRGQMRPERILVLGFLSLILVGAIFLMLPFASADGKSAGLMDSLFTSTSAVCVTGLVARDTGTGWSRFGQTVILLLIQLGGIGFMSFATLTMLALGRRITLKERVVIKESLNENNLSGLVRLTKRYALLVLLIEVIGAGVLAIRLIPRYGWAEGLYMSLFHAVSAFCNGGFDLFGNYTSLTGYSGDYLVLLTVSLLIILGGIGFSVIFECIRQKGRWKNLSLHAKIVLFSTGLLLLGGTVFFSLAEWNNAKTLGGMQAGDKILNGFFQSVTMRTAGFNSIDLAGMTDASKLFAVMLMFIGASPASTGGGVKTTTMSALLLIVISVIRGQKEINIMGRRLPADLMRRALTILFIAMMLMLTGAIAISLIEGGRFSLIDILFECGSAVGTVGVSSIGSPNLSLASRILLIPMMFFGRVGPLTMALALASKQNAAQEKIKYPEEKIMIG